MGDPQAAIHRVEMAESRSARLLALDGSDPENQLLLANALLEKARTQFKAGDATAAGVALRQALNRLTLLEKLNLPDGLKTSLEVALCESLVQKVTMRDTLVEREQTARTLTEAIAHGESAYRAQPSDPAVVDCYAKALEKLGSFYFDSGSLELFQAPVKKALTIRQDAAAEDPNNMVLQRGLERAIGNWGCPLTYFDPLGENEELAARSIFALRKLHAADPNNIDLAEEFMAQLRNYGNYLANHFRWQDSAKTFEETITLGKTLAQQKKKSYSAAYHIGEAGVNLVFCYLKLNELDAARRIDAEVLPPLMRELESRKSDSPDDRLLEAAFEFTHGEVIARSGETKLGRETFLHGLNLIEENLGVRDYPGEKALYGGALTRFGNILAGNGQVNLGVDYIQRGLQVMYHLRDANLTVDRGLVSSDISEAEANLRLYKAELQKDQLSLSTVAGDR
jgi:tetratricopeptide (TPR) repeat protein